MYESPRAAPRCLTRQLLTPYSFAMPDETSTLQREIQQRKPFRSRGQELVVGLLRTADLVRRAVDRTLAPYGITPQQSNVLRILRRAGAEGVPTLEIGARLLAQRA